MKLFLENGHLSEQALTLLAQGTVFDALSRLEIAEHLSYCDRCLQRYTDALEHTTLTQPASSCRLPLYKRARCNSLRTGLERCAAAVAAVALTLTLLWKEPLPTQFPSPPEIPDWTQQCSQLLTQLSGRLRTILEGNT